MQALVKHILGPGGALARALGKRFESREQQLAMAAAVCRAMESRSHLLAEAGTGVGKSFAYLVPAMVRCIKHNETVVIATNTISLQEQLITKDIPLLQSILLSPEVAAAGLSTPTVHREPVGDDCDFIEDGPRPFKAVLVKGRGNYVSIRRLKLASERQDKLLADPAARRSLHAIEDWAYNTPDGTLSTLPPLERGGVWDKVQSDSGNCMGRKCPTYEKCFYQRARREMENATLLVCNHALFFSDLALRGQEAGFLPTYQHVILDEAHGVEDVASEHFGASLTEGRIMHLLGSLYGQRTGKGYLPQLALMAQDTAGVDRAIRLVMDADAATRAFFEQVVQFVRQAPREGGSERPSYSAAGGSARIRTSGAIDNPLTPVMRELALRLKALRESVKNDADRYELNAYSIRAELVANEAALLVDQAQPGCAYWAEVNGADEGSRFQRVTLACAPVDVAPLLKERLFSQNCSITLTSATLATRGNKPGESSEAAEMAFAHTLSCLGCEGAKTIQLGSPFDHARQVEFYIDTRVEAKQRGGGGGSGSGSYTQRLADVILEHVRATDGGAFVLFTSFATLNACANALRRTLDRYDMPLLAQGQDGSRTHILDEFRKNDRSVLLGAASFWQGVDVRGRSLRNVIITKLPFDPPDRPLTQARHELILSKGGDPFREDSLPRAIVRFKQGFGRLIRSAEDHGRVVVLDGRLTTARYGRLFLDALPEGVRPRIMTADGEHIDSWE
ncbi:MAG: helicase C-terminal domain-containing protein [Planctomycetota bacterium]|nr:helicase C-terminal domain-containing protein [Planctomycetota bacterium]